MPTFSLILSLTRSTIHLLLLDQRKYVKRLTAKEKPTVLDDGLQLESSAVEKEFTVHLTLLFMDIGS